MGSGKVILNNKLERWYLTTAKRNSGYYARMHNNRIDSILFWISCTFFLLHLEPMPTGLAKHVILALFAKEPSQKPNAAGEYCAAHRFPNRKPLLIIAHDLNVGTLALRAFDRSHTVGHPLKLVIVYWNIIPSLRTGCKRDFQGTEPKM
jgi:hypothetical protein